ncbi:cyclin-dependent protein kinase complex component (Pcl8) [Purpureocillium lavendulum]|uniref:Cyclin-dependent protein kinase complex component (Pcl8) n=1 Tax=Purpureocillium lavendulum TaxID=1247861 RepID=A0AB34FZE2_9HYPO|nr:cyclin-dependent protein kinase complex component (Pcl8) [Purpureocillium lavendulum]
MASPSHEPARPPATQPPQQADDQQQSQSTSQSASASASAPASASADRTPPPPPVPSSDPRLLDDADPATPDEHDLFKLPPLDALKLLSASVELLVRMTGDIPPTPPPRTPTNPQMSDMQAEKDKIVRSHSEKNLARLRKQQQQQADDAAKQAAAEKKAPCGGDAPQNTSEGQGLSKLQAYSASMSAQLLAQSQHQATTTPPQEIDGVHLRQRSASPSSTSPQPYVIVGADSQPLNLQHGAITRKFYSKKEPPITIQQYLLRLHQFCPMSTAVYLATSLYIHRLAVEERAIPVTRRNAHRLVLAGLRVAMKALEDLSYPHSKMAKVGGVSEAELARLEISFCFLAGFELVVGEAPLREHWEALRDGRAQQMLRGTDVPTLRLGRRPREVTPASG